MRVSSMAVRSLRSLHSARSLRSLVRLVGLPSTVVAASLCFGLACGGTADGGNGQPPGPAPGATNDAGAVDAGEVEAAAPVRDAGPDVDNGAPSETYPAPHPAVPELVSSGGPVLKTPKVVPIFFPAYAYKTQILDYVAKLGATPFWKANVDEYKVGALSAGTAVELTETPPTAITDQEIQTWLAAKLDGTHPEFGTPDEQTIYTIYYPPTTVIDLGQGGPGGGSSKSCVAFGGYHENIVVGTKNIAYAVIPQCATFHALAGIDVVTGTSSHEWLEAATDPYPSSNPAYGGVDDDHLVFQFALGGGENGDLCAQYDSSFYKPAGFDYIVQRSWSNIAATAGHDPCVPGLQGQAYFNSAPVLNEPIHLAFGGQGIDTKGVHIAVGASKTIEVVLYSDAKTSAPWTVAAREPSRGGVSPATLDFKWDRTTGVNGEKLHVTITALKASTYKASSFIIVSSLGTQKAYWAGLVQN